MNLEEGEKKIVDITVNTLKLAERVIEELRRRDDEPYSEKPSVTELAVIAQTITVMSMNGAYKVMDNPEMKNMVKTSASSVVADVISAALKDVDRVIEEKVNAALAKRSRLAK